jgi:hypothetical protein
MHRWMVIFLIINDIWNVTREDNLGSKLSKSNMMRCELEGSIAPNVENKDFLCKG